MAEFLTQISFEGLNISPTLNTVTRHCPLYRISRNGKKCTLTVKSSDCGKVLAILHERCYNVTDVHKIGTSNFVDFFRKHFVLPVAFAVLAVMLFVCSQFCLKVEVSGDYSEIEVQSALEQCNVGLGTNLYDLDVDLLENRLATQLDAMYAVVNRKGCALYINAVKKKSVSAPIDMHIRHDIVANVCGKVVFLLCEQGTPLVKVGDTVKDGDVLVSGLRIFSDGTSEDVWALGKIVVQQECSAFAQFDGTLTEQVQTGNTFFANGITLFGKRYGKVCPFENFVTQSSATQLFPLNITVTHTVFFETTAVTRPARLEECVDELKAQALASAETLANFAVSSHTFEVTPDGVWATVYGQTEIC